MKISLTAEQIKSRLNSRINYPVRSFPVKGKYAAVLMPLIHEKSQWSILFTRRSDSVNDHKGQVSFPGGAIEPTDDSPLTAALREAEEEIGLKPDYVQVLGQLLPHESVTGYTIFPVVAQIQWPVPLKINPSEVSRVFTIPLDWLIKKENFVIRDWLSPFGLRRGVVFYRPYDGEQLWGISARILLDFLEKLGLVSTND
ncbi:NTP pyrophosphohydrolase including oxidative damage repair enzymes [Bellilinea caldifistulae]|uniref:CoA pyrophosphatase n=1 Tax=Bellilinea caldifistulae TaxID=360411 RepID=UPI0007801E99|nr:CoA pyrophosphatase [Bellilinea caldifistulae]GAP10738.1 NTP pyrophosphohydrolase including oxidative damage repair enzymes [Bellilinea caldifistulae]